MIPPTTGIMILKTKSVKRIVTSTTSSKVSRTRIIKSHVSLMIKRIQLRKRLTDLVVTWSFSGSASIRIILRFPMLSLVQVSVEDRIVLRVVIKALMKNDLRSFVMNSILWYSILSTESMTRMTTQVSLEYSRIPRFVKLLILESVYLSNKKSLVKKHPKSHEKSLLSS